MWSLHQRLLIKKKKKKKNL
jgi:hypothetical protein